MSEIANPAVKKPETPSPAIRFLVAGLSGLLLALCFPPFRFAYLLPLPIAGLLFAIRGTTPRLAGYLGLTFGLLWFGVAMHWLRNIYEGAAVSLWALAALFPMLFSVLFVTLRKRLPQIPEWLLAATLWTGIEYFRSEWMVPSCGFFGLGYGVVNARWLVAIASGVGCYGLSFAIVVLSTLLFPENLPPTPLLKERGRDDRHTSQPSEKKNGERGEKAGGFGAYRWLVLMAVWEVLYFLPSRPTPITRPLEVRLVQATYEDSATLIRYSTAYSVPTPQVIVWPESIFIDDPRKEPKIWPQIQGVARDMNAYLLFGAKDYFDPASKDRFYNTAFLLGPDGTEVGKHVKNHPIPFRNDGIPGKEASPLETKYGRLGVGICYDFDYSDVARRLAAAGAEVFLVPSNNPMEWGKIQKLQHLQMFQMRAVECGRWLGTADVAGNTALIDPNGKILFVLPTDESGAAPVTLGLATHQTFFVRAGWLFGPLCLFAMLALSLAGLLKGRFHPRREP